MSLTPQARLMTGVTLLTVPTIVFGGLTVLGVVTNGEAGLPGPSLSALQASLYRAGHAHAGVLVILALVGQVLLDAASLSASTKWVARICFPLAPILISGGFFGIAHLPALRVLLYAGAGALSVSVLLAGVGLVRRAPEAPLAPALTATR